MSFEMQALENRAIVPALARPSRVAYMLSTGAYIEAPRVTLCNDNVYRSMKRLMRGGHIFGVVLMLDDGTVIARSERMSQGLGKLWRHVWVEATSFNDLTWRIELKLDDPNGGIDELRDSR